MNRFLKVYRVLTSEYNTENWWPIYDGKEPFTEISVGAILTQNTNWKNVEKALKNLRDNDLLVLEKLQKIDEEKLRELIKPAGFYRRKAKTIKEFASKIRDTENISREFLLSIKGIGKETADSILLYALDKPVFIVDAYTKRLFSRLGLIEENLSYDSFQKEIYRNLPEDVDMFRKFHAGIVEHSKKICRKNPLCSGCPLEHICIYKKR